MLLTLFAAAFLLVHEPLRAGRAYLELAIQRRRDFRRGHFHDGRHAGRRRVLSNHRDYGHPQWGGDHGLQPAGTAVPGNEPFAVDNLVRTAAPQLTVHGFGFSLANGDYANPFHNEVRFF